MRTVKLDFNYYDGYQKITINFIVENRIIIYRLFQLACFTCEQKHETFLSITYKY